MVSLDFKKGPPEKGSGYRPFLGGSGEDRGREQCVFIDGLSRTAAEAQPSANEGRT